jgi:hypothetical protein
MLRIRKAGIAVLAVALVALVAPAGAAPLLGTKGAGDDADKWLIDNAEAVLTINIKGLLSAESVKKNVPMLKEAIKGNEQVKGVLDATGVDLFTDIHSVLISGTGGPAKDAKVLMVIKGNFNAGKMSAAAAKRKDEVKIHKEGATEVYEVKIQDQPAYAALVSRSTLVMTHSKEATLDAVKNGGKKAAKLSKEMQGALTRFSGKETMTFAMVVSDDLKKVIARVPQLAASGSKLQTLTGSITVTDGVALNVNGNTTDAKAAKQLEGVLNVLKGTAEVAVQGMEELPPVVGEVLGAVKIGTQKESVSVNLNITKELLNKLNKAGEKK